MLNLSYKNIASIEDSGDLLWEPNLKGTPERNLLMAMIERAALDYVGNDKELAQEAKDWLFQHNSKDELSPFTFVWVCKQLDLDPEVIAKKIKDMPKRGKNRVAPWYFLKRNKKQ